jgi:TonB-dependent receptor
MGVKADAGVRIVSTEQTSLGSQLVNTSYFPISVARSYTDVLPSANVRLGLTDDLVLRLATSKAMTRPDLASLSPMESVTPITDRATVGDPALAPYRLTQYDASLEWYFTKEGLLSAAVFRKDVNSFIVNVTTLQTIVGPDLFDGNGKNISGTLFNVTGPVNGTGGYVQGIELSYQQPFDFLPDPYDGFGVLTNYTHADSNTNVAVNGQNLNIPLPGQSDNSYTLSGYYDKGPINFRLAYTWRDKYLIQVFTGSRLQMEAPYGQVDLSARYNLSDQWAVTFDALNLADSKEYQYDNGPGKGPMAYLDYGQNFLFGVRAKL